MWTSPRLAPLLILVILAVKQIEGRDYSGITTALTTLTKYCYLFHKEFEGKICIVSN